MRIEVSDLPKPKWVDLHALVKLVPIQLSRPNCLSLSLLGRGRYNFIYKLQFEDGSDVAASISKDDEEDFNPSAKFSEISTMRYLWDFREHYLQISVPKIHVWDLSFNNPVGAPYVLMEVARGVSLNLRAAGGRRGLDSMTFADQLTIVNTLANIQASLSKPVSFDRIGSIYISEKEKYVVGELINIQNRIFGGPYSDISDLWYGVLEREVTKALKEWDNLVSDAIPDSYYHGTPQKFGELLQILSALVPYFTPPSSCLPLVLHHPDLALRNILFDEKDLTKPTAIIDWGGAQILPLIFTAHFPDDLMSTADEPVERQDNPMDEDWHTVPHDWTSLGDTSSWPQAFRAENDPVDQAAIGSTMVRRYYLRQYFGACFSRQMDKLHGDIDLSHVTVFRNAPYYLKFHEVIMGGSDGWFRHEKWILETFRRLNILGPPAGKILVGPNVYTTTAEELTYELGFLEKL